MEMMKQKTTTHRLESLLAIDKVQSAKDQLALSRLVSLGPRLGQQVPFGLELLAELAAKAGLESGKEDGDGIVARVLGQVGVRAIVELERAAGAELLVAVAGEAVDCGFGLCGEGGKGQQGSRQGREEPHRDGDGLGWGLGGRKERWEAEMVCLCYVCVSLRTGGTCSVTQYSTV